MSLRIYCFSCGQHTEYSLSLPIFCCSCGGKFNQIQAENKKEVKNIVIQEEPETIDIDNLEFTGNIETFGDKRGIKLGELAKEEKTGFSRPIPPKISKKKAMELFKLEASKPARIEVSDAGRE